MRLSPNLLISLAPSMMGNKPQRQPGLLLGGSGWVVFSNPIRSEGTEAMNEWMSRWMNEWLQWGNYLFMLWALSFSIDWHLIPSIDKHQWIHCLLQQGLLEQRKPIWSHESKKSHPQTFHTHTCIFLPWRKLLSIWRVDESTEKMTYNLDICAQCQRRWAHRKYCNVEMARTSPVAQALVCAVQAC